MDNSDENTGGDSLDVNYGLDDIAPETRAEMERECAEFWEQNRVDLRFVSAICDSTRAGHNFWLNRNGHGSGFWDEYFGYDLPLRAAFERLSKASKAFGNYDLYVGDDGKIYGG